METFLADYGLVWVGSNRSDSDSDSETSSIEKTECEYDWNKIVRNVKEEVLHVSQSMNQTQCSTTRLTLAQKGTLKKELNEIAGFDKIESKKKNGAQESDIFWFFAKTSGI